MGRGLRRFGEVRMTTAWYYDYYEKGMFPHQQALCDAVRWTKCTLDGQVLVSPTQLTGVPTNPLTLRLRTLQNVLDQLEKEINCINKEIEKKTNEQINRCELFEMYCSLHTQDSKFETGGAAIEEISLCGNKPIILRYDTLHFALYDFFTNLGSILDRLAYEINLLYGLGDWLKDTLDWVKLTNPSKSFLKSLILKDQNLAKFIQNRTPNFKKVPDYRNRLIHDSIITTKIEAIGFPRRFCILLLQDPKDVKSRIDVDAIKFCKEVKANLLELLDGSYELMLQYYRAHGAPPW